MASRQIPSSSSRLHLRRRRWSAVGALTALALAAAGCSSGGSSSTGSATASGAATLSSSTSASAKASTGTPKASPTPRVSTAAGLVAPVTGHGVGQPVTHPSCATPPAPWKTFTAPNKVVPDLPSLEKGTNHAAVADNWTYPASKVRQWMEKPSTAPKGKKLVFVTFDDGPDPKITPEELTNLENAHVPATFFMITPQLQGVPSSLLERSLKDGNGLDIHSYSHDYSYLYKGDAAERAQRVTCDYDWALAQARDVIGSDYFSSGFRYPGGHMSWNYLSQADAELAQRGVVPIDWNAMSGDADVQMPTTIPGYLAMVKQTIAEAGNPRVVVILNHDVKQPTAEAMPSILAWLKSAGYQFGVIS